MYDRIAIDPEILSGKPHIRGKRFPVFQIVNLVANGHSFDEIQQDFPYLEKEDIRQALLYAAHLAQYDWIAI